MLKDKTRKLLAVAKTTRIALKKQHPLASVAASKAGKSYARKNKKVRKALAEKIKAARKDPANERSSVRAARRAGWPNL